MLRTKVTDISPEDEKRLVYGCKARDRSCQSELYGLFGFRMMVVCLRYAKNKEEAEEILQDGFMRAFRCIDQFKWEGSFEGWVRRIMINCSLRKYRSQIHLYPVLYLEEFPTEPMEDEDITANLTSKELIKLVQQLPPACRMVFNLFVFEGMKHRQIAALLNISEGTSKSNLSDARAILKKSIYRNYEIAK
jgi:RNA polymerase sigma-70 factor (ECF subfamily)